MAVRIEKKNSGGDPEINVNRILVPIDFSLPSKSALNYAVPIAHQFNAELILMYVVEPTVYPHDFGFGHLGMAELEQELTEKGITELANVIENVVRNQVPARAIVRTGKPYMEIITTALDEDVDLIIIATHGHTNVENLLFGSTAELVVRKAHCSVLCWRAGGDENDKNSNN